LSFARETGRGIVVIAGLILALILAFAGILLSLSPAKPSPIAYSTSLPGLSTSAAS
jgi:hypothetical protein